MSAQSSQNESRASFPQPPISDASQEFNEDGQCARNNNDSAPQPHAAGVTEHARESARVADNHGSALTGIAFPESAIVGSLGEAAEELTRETEMPRAFVYSTLLTLAGDYCSGRLTVDTGLKSDTRLYTILLGDSAEMKKSSAKNTGIEFFRSLDLPETPFILEGVGSAEGLAKALERNPRTVLCYDEVRAFVDKTKIQGSVLLPMATQLFEHDSYDNFTKERTVSIKNAKLGFIGCATTGTYENMWTSEAIDIGFLNRLFVVGAEPREKVLFPKKRDEHKLNVQRDRIRKQFERLPLEFSITPDAQAELEDWYRTREGGEQSRRLDTLMRHLLPLIALITDKDKIDLETAKTVRQIIEYEINIRKLVDPVDAEGVAAKMEEKIRRALKASGPLSESKLKRACNYSRYGVEVFRKALNNLKNEREVEFKGSLYSLVEPS